MLFRGAVKLGYVDCKCEVCGSDDHVHLEIVKFERPKLNRETS